MRFQFRGKRINGNPSSRYANSYGLRRHDRVYNVAVTAYGLNFPFNFLGADLLKNILVVARTTNGKQALQRGILARIHVYENEAFGIKTAKGNTIFLFRQVKRFHFTLKGCYTCYFYSVIFARLESARR